MSNESTFNKRKKGATMIGLVIVFILALVSFAVLFTVIKFFAEKGEVAGDIAACRLKLEKAAASKVAGITLIEDAECKTNKVYLLAPGEGKVKKGTEIKNEEEIAQKILDEMVWCWESHGKGKLDYVSDWHVGISDEETYCSICSYIHISDKIVLERIDNFEKYLELKKNGETYGDYFGGGAMLYTDKMRGEINLPVEDLVVVYFLGKERGDLLSMDSLKGAAKTGIGGGVVGILFGPKGAAAGALFGAVSSYIKKDQAYTFVGVQPLKDVNVFQECKVV